MLSLYALRVSCTWVHECEGSKPGTQKWPTKTSQGCMTHSDTISCSTSRPPCLGGHAHPGKGTGCLLAVLDHTSQKLVVPTTLIPHPLTWIKASSSPSQLPDKSCHLPSFSPCALLTISQDGDLLCFHLSQLNISFSLKHHTVYSLIHSR